MLVSVYLNIRLRLFSIIAEEGRNKGLVIDHASRIEIENPSFVVRPSGRKRFLRTGQKNVHAFVRGRLAGALTANGALIGKPSAARYRRAGSACRYNPARDESFVVGEDRAPCRTAKSCLLEIKDGRASMTVLEAA